MKLADARAVPWSDAIDPPTRFAGELRTPMDLEATIEFASTDDGPMPVWRVRSFEVAEALHEPYRIAVTLISTELDFEIDRLLGVAMSLRVDRPTGEQRSFAGLVLEVEYIETRDRRLSIRVIAGPAIARLGATSRRRIFEGMTVPEVVETIAGPWLRSQARVLDDSRLTARHEPRDYCVQHDESDLDFLLRILAEDGITLAFEEGTDGETAVLVDDHPFVAAGASRLEDPGAPIPLIPLRPDDPHSPPGVLDPSMRYFGYARGNRTPRHLVHAWDWKDTTPAWIGGVADDDTPHPFEIEVHGPARLHEDPSMNGAHRDDAQRQATFARSRDATAARRFYGVSDVLELAAGSNFELTDHPHAELDSSYAVLEVIHRGDLPEAELGAVAEDTARYENELRCVRTDEPYRPALRPKPRIHGTQTGLVVGPQDEEIHTDRLGRVLVQLSWHRGDQGPATWIRVAQSWAGPGFGTLFIPRIGMEVLVTFVDGDPDRPIVTGCLYNGFNPPPLPLPECRTQSTIRTQSTPGEGHNELRFEDAQGREEIYMHAQRNLRERVRGSHSTSVGGSRTVTIGGPHRRSVAGGEIAHIGEGPMPTGDPSVPEHSQQLFVDGAKVEHVVDTHSVHAKGALWSIDETMHASADQFMWLSCGPGPKHGGRRPTTPSLIELNEKAISLESKEKIELRVGETRVVLTPDGIELHGDLVVAKSKDSTLTMDEQVRLAGGTTSGGSALTMGADLATLEAPEVNVNSGTAVTLTAGSRCRIETPVAEIDATGTLHLKATAINSEATRISAEAKVDHVIAGMPVRIN